HIVDGNGVDSGGSQKPGIIPDAIQPADDPPLPKEERLARITALDAPVEIIPVVDHPQPVSRIFDDLQGMEGPACLHQPEQMEGSVKRAPARLSEEKKERISPALHGFQEVSLFVQPFPHPPVHPAPSLC